MQNAEMRYAAPGKCADRTVDVVRNRASAPCVAKPKHGQASKSARPLGRTTRDEAALVSTIRAASRALVRELGLLAVRARPGGFTLAECHALLELDASGTASMIEIADRLRIDKAATSRTLAALTRRGLVHRKRDRSDARRTFFVLSARGRLRTREINAAANATVAQALSRVEPPLRRAIADHLNLYARALNQSRRAARYELRPIETRDDRAMAAIIRDVMTEHGASGAGFAIHDAEVDAMSKAYRMPHSRYFVVVRDGKVVVGGGGFAPLANGGAKTCELRKMYFRPECRGLGIGRALLERLLVEMRRCGYRRCYLETLESMKAARKLYEECGFRPRCSPLGDTGHFSCDAWYERAL